MVASSEPRLLHQTFFTCFQMQQSEWQSPHMSTILPSLNASSWCESFSFSSPIFIQVVLSSFTSSFLCTGQDGVPLFQQRWSLIMSPLVQYSSKASKPLHKRLDLLPGHFSIPRTPSLKALRSTGPLFAGALKKRKPLQGPPVNYLWTGFVK